MSPLFTGAKCLKARGFSLARSLRLDPTQIALIQIYICDNFVPFFVSIAALIQMEASGRIVVKPPGGQ